MSKNLMPEVAKLLGVEIGEEFSFSWKNGTPDEKHKFENGKLLYYNENQDEWQEDDHPLYELLTGEFALVKLPKVTLTQAERTILENLPKEYEWIARDEDNTITVFIGKPTFNNDIWENTKIGEKYSELHCYNHLFKFIKWEDNKPYNIKELLEGSDEQ